jgi:hypothetical protein
MRFVSLRLWHFAKRFAVAGFALYESTPTIVLNVPTISALSRHVRLAGYFKLSIQDYLSFLSLSGKVQLVLQSMI